MKFHPNQSKRGQTSKSETKLKTTPFKKRDPFFKKSQSNGKNLALKLKSTIQSDLVTKIEKREPEDNIKTRMSLGGATKPKLASHEREWYVDADDWLETSVERNEIDSILPTKTCEENASIEPFRQAETIKDGGENSQITTVREEDESKRQERAGVQMFSGTSNLKLGGDFTAATKEKPKRKRKTSQVMSRLYQGDASVLDKLSYFEDKVKELTACEKLSGSKRRQLSKYQKFVAMAHKFKAGDLSFMKKIKSKRNANQSKADVTSKVGAEGKSASETSKKSRYVLFVGNLPYTIDQHRIIEHFRRAGKVASVRIPTDKETNKSRGFAFVELTNKESYEKALSLHHTFLEGRRINVLYTNSKEQEKTSAKKSTKAKNLKLAAMRKQGLLTGSVKESQKRSTRRAKKNKAAATTE